MNKRELERLTAPVDPDKAAVEITYEPSKDARVVTLTFKSDTPMTALDFALALLDYTYDFIRSLYNRETN